MVHYFQYNADSATLIVTVAPMFSCAPSGTKAKPASAVTPFLRRYKPSP